MATIFENFPKLGVQGGTAKPHDFTYFYVGLNDNKTLSDEISCNQEKEV